MSELMRYSHGKELAYYSDGSIAHRHAFDSVQLNPLGCKQGYYSIIDGKCSKCGKTKSEIVAALAQASSKSVQPSKSEGER